MIYIAVKTTTQGAAQGNYRRLPVQLNRRIYLANLAGVASSGRVDTTITAQSTAMTGNFCDSAAELADSIADNLVGE